MGVFGNKIKYEEKDDGGKPRKQSGKKTDASKRISGGEILDVIRLSKLKQFAWADVAVGMNNIFAKSDKQFSERRMGFHKHHSSQIFLGGSDMVIFVPKNRRRIIVIFEISEIRKGQDDGAVNYQDGSFSGKKMFEIHNCKFL